MNPSASPPAGGAPAAAVLRLWSGYVTALKVFAGVSMLVVVVVMVAQVAARYLFGGSIIWAEELCRYILIWQTFLLIGLAYHQGELVALDLLSHRLSRGMLLVLRLVISLPVWLFLWLMVDHGLTYASRFTGQSIPAVDFIWQSLTGQPASLPVFWVYVAVPVGCGLLLVHLIGSFGHDLWAFATGRPDPHAKSVIAPLSAANPEEGQP
ncbi:TRAP transporter small permease [Pseudogemmobacter bohemicus]|uniref:TRAP transporter small permease n=1 Tax=Pseudogemmobacter bohemicus TaxID=2250708 RepID=UPI000DD36239|nr:TRAP transporter small permease [Pseudogemmobacter bohemicus]